VRAPWPYADHDAVADVSQRVEVGPPRAGPERLRRHLDEAQLMELTYVIALENLRGRFNLALGVGAAGFSEGMVCALPTTPT
jgi:alkylhydroperoxidase family enzyme